MGLLVEGETGDPCVAEPVGDITKAVSPFTVPWFSLDISPHLSCPEKKDCAKLVKEISLNFALLSTVEVGSLHTP
jgi:hypothetical protein